MSIDVPSPGNLDKIADIVANFISAGNYTDAAETFRLAVKGLPSPAIVSELVNANLGQKLCNRQLKELPDTRKDRWAVKNYQIVYWTEETITVAGDVTPPEEFQVEFNFRDEQ